MISLIAITPFDVAAILIALAATYIAVLFSVIAQGGTVERVIRWRPVRSEA